LNEQLNRCAAIRGLNRAETFREMVGLYHMWMLRKCKGDRLLFSSLDGTLTEVITNDGF